MATTTFYSTSEDGNVYGNNATYSTARSTVSGVETGQTQLIIGQYISGNYSCNENCLQFDTSSLQNNSTVSAAVLDLYGQLNASTTDFTITAAIHDWGATLTTGDWVAGASLSAKTTVATYDTSIGWSTSAYNTFTNVAFPSNVSLTGSTRLILYSSRHSGNNAPSGNEYVQYYCSEQTGTTNDPKLTVTHTTPTIEIKKVAGVANV